MLKQVQHDGELVIGPGPTRRATCACGQLAIECAGGPMRVSAVVIGASADPSFPPPVCSVYKGCERAWVGTGIDHYK